MRTLPLRSRVITADTLHMQVAWARTIVEQGGHYLLCVKPKQPTLHGDLALYCATPRVSY